MSDEKDKRLADAEQYWGKFESRVKEGVDTYLNGCAFDQKTFNRYLFKLSRRFGVDMSETEIDATRVALTERMKNDVTERLDAIANNMDFTSKFAELIELIKKAPEDKVAIRNMQNPRMDMEMYKLGETEKYLKIIEDAAEMYEEMNEDTEGALKEMVGDMMTTRDWINQEIERRASANRNAHSEGNDRRAIPRRRSSLNATLPSRRSIGNQ